MGEAGFPSGKINDKGEIVMSKSENETKANVLKKVGERLRRRRIVIAVVVVTVCASLVVAAYSVGRGNWCWVFPYFCENTTNSCE